LDDLAIRAGARVAGWLVMLLLAAVAVLPAARAQAGPVEEVGLRGEWRPAEPSGQASLTTRFEPTKLTSFGRTPGGAWVSLRPRSGEWPRGTWVLSVESPGFQGVTLHAPGEPPRRAHLLGPAAGGVGYGRLAFQLDALPAGASPLRLHVDATGAIPSPMTFAVRSPSAQARVEAGWLAFATACLATMAITAVIALLFGLRLRDPAFGYYAAYVVGYALIQAAQTGYIVRPLGWDALAATLPTWGRAVTALSVVSAVLFLDRFVLLRERLPRLRRLLMGYCGLMLVLLVAGYVPGLQAPARGLINPLLILGGPLLLGTAVAAACQGSRYALIFLLGWAPLLAVTVLGSLQLYGIAPQWTWSDDAGLAVGAFEAIVLSLGLAERAASVRRQRDDARVLAQTDPLTGTLNRRALRDRVQRAIEERDRFALLYLDLDHFKRINDRLGHDAGDRVLQLFVEVVRSALREGDVIGRYGGEEFVVGLLHTGLADAVAIAERIRAGLQAHATPELPLTVSIGVAIHRPGEALDDLVRRADAALYRAKDAGRDRVLVD
jgi:diguanylate cyclase (GGDEF)-like protein